MTLFRPVTLIDGSMPVTHIAVVTSVSFIDDKMGIEIISKFPSFRVPRPTGSSEALAYYHPGVPYEDPEASPKVIPSEYISARYFMVGEKVTVVQSGQTYFVLGSINPLPDRSLRTFVGLDIDHPEWLSQLNGAVSWKNNDGLGHQRERIFLLADGTLIRYNFISNVEYSFLEAYTGYYGGFYPCFNLSDDYTHNAAYPVNVGPNPSIVHLSTWTWGRGEYNYAHTNYIRSRSLDETIEVPSFLFPTAKPIIRLEIQAASPSPTVYPIDGFPNIEFYTTGADLGYALYSEYRDFSSIDSFVSLRISRPRPWGIQPTNTQKWATLNWTPSILVCPIEGSTTGKLTYGFIDIVKDDYSGTSSRGSKGNILHLLTGEITVTEDLEFVGKEQLDVNDYTVSSIENYEELTSEYEVDIDNTWVGIWPDNVVTQTIDLTGQEFIICTDGTNILKKVPTASWSRELTSQSGPGDLTTFIETLDIEQDIYVNNSLICTSTFTYYGTDEIGDPRILGSQKQYIFHQIDLINKLFIADIIEYDSEDSNAQSITRVAIDGNTETEYIIWTYTPFTPSVGAAVNVPPWDQEVGFPAFPDHRLPPGSESFSYTAKVWKQPRHMSLNFPVNDTPGSDCTINYVFYAVENYSNYPFGPLDEDIRSIVLIATVNYESGASTYVQAKENVYMKPRRNGWIAYGRCCLDPDSGVIDYPYNSDVIKKVDGLVTDALELYDTPDEINVYEDY